MEKRENRVAMLSSGSCCRHFWRPVLIICSAHFPSCIPQGISSGVPIRESGAFGCFLEHLGRTELQKQMSNIPNSQCSHQKSCFLNPVVKMETGQSLPQLMCSIFPSLFSLSGGMVKCLGRPPKLNSKLSSTSSDRYTLITTRVKSICLVLYFQQVLNAQSTAAKSFFSFT